MTYTQMIEALYIILVFLAFIMEMSHRVDTDHFLKKVGLFLIAMGSILHVAHKENHLVPIGLSFYFGVIIIRVFTSKYGRRTTDRRVLDGKR